MNHAIELYHTDGTGAGVFFCSVCRSVYESRETAEACHGERLCACGARIRSVIATECDECQIRHFE